MSWEEPEGDSVQTPVAHDREVWERNRLVASIALFAGAGLLVAAPFALRAGAPFFMPLTTSLVIAITLVPFLEWLERRHIPSPIAALIALGPSRPHMLLATAPERGPWLTPAKFNEIGGVVVWRASDTAGTPPADITRQFPGLVPEVPQSFDRLVNGRQGPLRIGWAIVRPKAP